MHRQKSEHVWVRASPKSWRKPKKRLTLKDERYHQEQQQQQVPVKKLEHNLGWGVTAPAKGQKALKPKAAKGKALPAAGAAPVAAPKNPPNVQTRAAAAAKAKGVSDAGGDKENAVPDANLKC